MNVRQVIEVAALGVFVSVFIGLEIVQQGRISGFERRVIEIKSDFNKKTEQLEKLADTLKEKNKRLSRLLRSESKKALITDVVYRSVGADTDDPYLGSPEACVRMMVFSDFTCKSCRDFHQQTIAKVRSSGFLEKDLHMIYRDWSTSADNPFPTAAHCAGEQGKYWQMYDFLMNLKNINQSSPKSILTSASSSVGLDEEQFLSCVDAQKYDTEHELDKNEGTALGARGAPGAFIGHKYRDGFRGVFIRGAQPYSVFERTIREMKRVGCQNS